jgi:hypothetical protein
MQSSLAEEGLFICPLRHGDVSLPAAVYLDMFDFESNYSGDLGSSNCDAGLVEIN